MNIDIVKNIPNLGKSLAFYGRAEVVDKLGPEVIRKAVLGILKGENVRSLTENMTKRRMSLSAASMLVTYMKTLADDPKFSDKYGEYLTYALHDPRINKSERHFVNWMAGLTEKQIQNVLRKDDSMMDGYIKDTDKLLRRMSVLARKEFGDIQSKMAVGGKECTLSWLEFVQLFMAVGTQAVAIRGSEKSTYGKMFEKLVLGSVLTLCGFDFVQRNDTKKDNKIFWLSERNEKRESDATALITLGKGIRFDIGFIGTGNTEVSLDKVTRFEKIIDFNNKKYDMATVIIVDKIGERSRITELAKDISKKYHIIQMSASNWVKELSDILYEDFNYKTPMYGKNESRVFDYIDQKLGDADMAGFLRAKTVKAKRK